MKDARQEQLKREALTDRRRTRIAWGVIWGMLLAACAAFALATCGSYTDFCASRPLALDRLPYALTTYDVGQVRDEGALFSFDFLDAGALVEAAPAIVEATCTGQRTHRYDALLTDVTIDRVYRGEGLPGIAVGERISVYEPIAIDNIAKRSSPFSALSKLLSEGDTEVRTEQVPGGLGYGFPDACRSLPGARKGTVFVLWRHPYASKREVHPLPSTRDDARWRLGAAPLRTHGASACQACGRFGRRRCADCVIGFPARHSFCHI